MFEPLKVGKKQSTGVPNIDLNFPLTCCRHIAVMYQSIPAAPSPPPPRATAGYLPALSVPGVGHFQILHCPVAGHLPNPGPFPSFWHARSFLSEYNYTEGFTGKTQIGSSVKDRNKLKRGVKACSRFYACISSLLIKQEFIPRKPEPVDVNQRFLVIESNFCWYFLKNILSYL